MQQSEKKAEHFFKNLLLDAFLALRAPKAPTGRPTLTPADTVVFLRLNRIGDALVSTPLMQFIKLHYGCRTVVVASRHNHFVFAHNASVNEVVIHQKGPTALFDTLRQVQAYQPTLVIDLHEQLSTTVSLLAGLLRAPYKFAIHKKNARLFTHTVADLDPARHHVLERLAHLSTLLAPAGPGPELRVFYQVSAAATEKAREFLRRTFPGARRFVGINTSAGGEPRFWGADNFRRLVEDVRALGYTPVVLTAPADLVRLTPALDPALVFCSTSFEEFAAVISQLPVLFTPDTAAVHVAAAYHIPVFGLYVAERPGHLNWFPYGSRYDWLITPQALRDLPYEQVWGRFSRFLAELPVE